MTLVQGPRPEGGIGFLSFGAQAAVDLNESAFVNPRRARAQVVQALHDRGYRTNASSGGGGDVGQGLDTVDFRLNVSENRMGVEGARYRWGIVVGNTSSEANFTEEVAQVTQDAVTGEILSMKFEPRVGTAPPGRGGSIPGFAAVAAVLALGFATAQRRG